MRLSHYIQSYQPFPAVIPVQKASSLRVTHPSAMITSPRRKSSHRLACVKHSVSVHPEPGSNSSFNSILFTFFTSSSILLLLPVQLSLSSPTFHSRLTKIILSNFSPFVNTFFPLFFDIFLIVAKYPFFTGFLSLIFLKSVLPSTETDFLLRH